MLYELYVENIALLRKVRLKLSPGMNALTGETGAGKSLVVDAVSLLIGGRGSDGFIRSGEDRAVVEGVFMPPFPAGNERTGKIGSKARQGAASSGETATAGASSTLTARTFARLPSRLAS